MHIRKFTSRNTKSEILKGYNDLAKAYKDLESKKPSAPTPAAAPVKKAASAPSGRLDMTSVIAQLSTLSDQIGASTGSLQQKLTAEATNLEDLAGQSADALKRLKDLHGLDVGDDTLAKLVEEYKASAEKFRDDLKAKKEAFEKELSEKRESWRKEQDEHGRGVKDRMVELKKGRTRDNQEYKYDLELKRAKEDDEIAQAQKAFEAELAALREAQETKWTEREKALAEREQEFADLKAKSEGFKDKLAKAIKDAESSGMNAARRKTKVEADLAAKEAEGKERVYKLRVKSLEETIAKQNKQLDNLSAQLEATNKRSQDLAVRAIEGASNASSFKAIQEIAMEQAKNSGKGK